FMAEIGKRFIDAGVDGLWAGGDIAYKNGPFFSPELYRKLLQPAHRRMFAPFRRRRLPVIYHCDGNVNLLIPDLIEAGITALQPLEVKAGMDVRELKERYGDRLALMGNIDVRVLSSDNPDEIRGEVATKTSIAGQGGGYVIGSDHSIPPSVSLRSYRLFLKAARKYGTYPLRAP
ncbi:TPA: hypothetical protein EYP44_02990, partial [Candidatus Bathyarchaeota archaeon]|nr:hypothetical protein [Candidatus Bathyarchaeota archaeon]